MASRRFSWKSVLSAALLGGVMGVFGTRSLLPILSEPPTPAAVSAIEPLGDPRRPDLEAPQPSVTVGADSFESWMAKASQPPTAEQVAAFLDARGRDAESLTTMFNITKDESLLREALESFPDDPKVLFAAINAAIFSVEDKQKWSERLVASDPNNALAYYLAAQTYADDPARAASFLIPPAEATEMDDYQKEHLINLTAFHVATGMPLDQAQLAAGFQRLSDPTMNPTVLAKLPKTLGAYARELRDAGDIESADQIAANTLAMSQRYGQAGRDVIAQLVGLNMEASLLRTLEPDGNYSFLRQTPAAEIATLSEQALSTSASLQNPDAMERWHRAPFEDAGPVFREFLHRSLLLGESKALEWMNQQTPPEP